MIITNSRSKCKCDVHRLLYPFPLKKVVLVNNKCLHFRICKVSFFFFCKITETNNEEIWLIVWCDVKSRTASHKGLARVPQIGQKSNRKVQSHSYIYEMINIIPVFPEINRSELMCSSIRVNFGIKICVFCAFPLIYHFLHCTLQNYWPRYKYSEELSGTKIHWYVTLFEISTDGFND